MIILSLFMLLLLVEGRLCMKKNYDYKITFVKFIKHLHVVNRHRFKVFLFCCKVGIPFQGLIHDLSKYSPTEFFESVRYFQGDRSPIKKCKEVNGYSKAWLHHKGRNKHHYEYWYDYNLEEPCPIIPFKYVLEMLCDSFAAGMTYQGKKWTKEYQLGYWNKVKDDAKMRPEIKKVLTEVYEKVATTSLKEGLNKKFIKELYQEYVIDKKNKK